MRVINHKYVILICIVFALLLFVYKIHTFLLQEKIVFSKLNIKPNRDIIIWVDTFYDNCQRYYYQSKNDEIMTSQKFIGCNKTKAQFSLVLSKDRNIVGIVEDENPDLVLAVHDFQFGENCPTEKDDDEWKTLMEKRRCLLDRLKEANPQRKLFSRDD